MIISVSRRTDIPSFYADWFYQRIKKQYVLVKNPMNARQIRRIDLSPDVVDCIVFWTKNPGPMMSRLDELRRYTYYFQFTLNAYETDVEPGIPDKNEVIIPIFQQLSDKIGKDKVIWRYDPILLNDKYTVAFHIEHFAKLVSLLKDYTRKCTISFIDLYKNTARNVEGLRLTQLTYEEKIILARELSEIASANGLILDCCAEDIDLQEYNITHAKCIDDRLIEEITGYSLAIKKDKNQRKECGCVTSIDIGMYNTCLNGCKYCYANLNSKMAKANFNSHDWKSPLLSGKAADDVVVQEPKIGSCKKVQISLFDGEVK